MSVNVHVFSICINFFAVMSFFTKMSQLAPLVACHVIAEVALYYVHGKYNMVGLWYGAEM